MFSIETQTDFPTLHGRVETRGGVITEGTHKRALCSVPTLNALFIFLSSRSAVPTYIPTYLLRVVLFGIYLFVWLMYIATVMEGNIIAAAAIILFTVIALSSYYIISV